MTATPICFIDTETTGLHPNRRPWEIAMIRRDDQGTTETLLQVSDIDLSDADPMALKIGGFYERHGSYRPDANRRDFPWPFVEGSDTLWTTEEEAAEIVEETTRGAIVVGANVGFDTDTLAPLLRRHRLLPAWHYRPVCIEAVAYGYLHGRWAEAGGGALPPIRLPWKSDHLSDLLRVEAAAPEDRHTALGDARWVMRMWDRITGGAA